MRRLVLAGALALAPVAAQAQTAPDQTDIIVTGRPEADRKAAEKFVWAISVRSDNQLARFHQPVCPVVIGMPKPYSTTIEDRIRATAVAAGVAVAKKARCSPNLIVVIAESGSALVADIRKNRPGWLEGVASADIDALIAPGPTRAWSVTSLRNEDGRGLGVPPPGSGATGDPLGDKPMLRVMTASIIKQPTRQDMEASFVVIDQAATLGLTLRQIADYAAMRGLARTRPPGEKSDIGTILAVFDPSAANRPREMTSADTAYLAALYKSPGTEAAVNERARIARRISKGK
ncbi:MAG: hypothetical protein V4459_03295 [Pseudomonadota bacterium]